MRHMVRTSGTLHPSTLRNPGRAAALGPQPADGRSL
jgi:hypothetical protein